MDEVNGNRNLRIAKEVGIVIILTAICIIISITTIVAIMHIQHMFP